MLNENQLIVFQDRYAADNENWEAGCRRQGVGAAQAEVPEKRAEYEEAFGEIIYNLMFLPGGRILRGLGHPMVNLLNCFVLDIGDSMESIGATLNKMWQISAEGGGVGINFSKIRPGGEPLKRKGGVASGPVSFMYVFDEAAARICSGGARRAALKGTLNVSHPDILKFISAKLDNNELTNFNISVGYTRQFIDAVRKKKKWELRFGGRTFEKVWARDLWMQIMEYGVRCGDPGLENVDNITINNSYYYAPVISTNPCGELPLEDHGSCCLGHINLSKFVTDSGRTKWQEMEKTLHLAVRFIDNIIDVNNYFLPECKQAAFRGRRIGLGMLGLGDYLFKKEIRYGSEKCVEELDNLGRFIRDASYATSIQLAEEKGSFQAFDRELYTQAKFIKRLPRHLQRKIYERGIRNVTLNTVAPTGTVSLLADVTSGCEPLFSKAYERTDRIKKKGKKKGEKDGRIYIHPLYKEFLMRPGAGTTLPDWYVDAFDITPFEHLEVQATIQKYVDGAISKTINCPSETTAERLSSYLLRYADDLKGATVYVDRSKRVQVLNPLSPEEARQALPVAGDQGEVAQCATGVCDV